MACPKGWICQGVGLKELTAKEECPPGFICLENTRVKKLNNERSTKEIAQGLQGMDLCITGNYCHRRVGENVNVPDNVKTPQTCYKGFSCVEGEKYIWVS